jgi:uncharacterized membrane protein
MPTQNEIPITAGRTKPGVNTFSRLRWWLIILFFLFIVLMTLTYFINNPLLISIDSILVTAFLFIIAVLHGIKRYGIKNMVVFFLITFIVSYSFENLSILTGFPFGFYHYSSSLGVLTVPLVIIFAYFAMGYLSWMLAHILTGQYGNKIKGIQVFIVPLIAAFIMVMWDLTIDPISSTLQKLWVWHEPGAYFGVPISNFFGWFLVVFLFFQLYTIYLLKYDRADSVEKPTLRARSFWMEVPAVYGTMALGNLLSVFYQYNDITLSMALVTVFTMIFVSIIAGIMILGNPALTGCRENKAN